MVGGNADKEESSDNQMMGRIVLFLAFICHMGLVMRDFTGQPQIIKKAYA